METLLAHAASYNNLLPSDEKTGTSHCTLSIRKTGGGASHHELTKLPYFLSFYMVRANVPHTPC